MITRRAALAAPAALAARAQPPPTTAAAVPTPLAAAPLAAGRLHAVAVPLAGRVDPVRAWLYLPRESAAGTAAGAWPLVVFLHGSGERGDDLARVAIYGLPRLVARGGHLPFVLFAPQLPARRVWNPAELHALVGALQARLAIDADRVCATGLSLGGHGVWRWAAAHPRDLAAIAPVCGYGDPAAVCAARDVPVRAYHGADDPVVPLAAQQACIDALRACGGRAEFIVYPGVGHDAWTPAYDDPALVPWLLAQRRRPRPA